jgi:4-oxalocrotonate tautomerase
MPVIRVELSKGRNENQKRAVAEAVTEAMVEHCNCTPESVHVVFFDVENSDWAVAGKFLSDPK